VLMVIRHFQKLSSSNLRRLIMPKEN